MARDAIDSTDLAHLREAIGISREASRRGDEPYGAVLADGTGKRLTAAGNTQVSSSDCTGHAETNLLREASLRYDRRVLASCTVYASGEPCAMCAGALYYAGVRRVVFALPAERMRALAGDVDELLLGCREVLSRGMTPVIVLGPALEEEAAAVLAAHYARGD